MTSEAPQTRETCFHHTDRETGRHCTRCGRPACPDCLVQASVGSQCFECVKADAPPRTDQIRRQLRGSDMPVTKALIAINAVIFLYTTANQSALDRLGLYGPFVANGDWYRIVTSGFIHYNLIHIGFNMLILWQVGMVLERGAGSGRFAAIYGASLFGGSLGALLATPHAISGGASGAVFGVMGAAALAMYRNGVPFWQTGFGPLAVIDLVFSFVVPDVSWGAHVGGLITGLLVAEAMLRARKTNQPWLGYAAAVALGAIGFFGCIAVAGR
jgi:membrane associated rhomboid family serine protease